MRASSSGNEPRSWIQAYYPTFDGLRGVAILLVFICHYAPSFTSARLVTWCWVGVDLFFVLSGFLITGTLDSTASSASYYRTFYKRGALRILPLYYGLIFSIYIACWTVHGISADRTFFLNAVYLVNLALPWLNWETHNPTVVHCFYLPLHKTLLLRLGIFWSLCVEEHFYLIWPVIVRHIRSRAKLKQVCLGAIASVVVLRFVLFQLIPHDVLKKEFLYISTFSRVDELLIGAWCALWLKDALISQAQLRRRAYSANLAALALLIIGVAAVPGGDVFHITNPFVSTVGFTLIGVAAASVLLVSLDALHPVSSMLTWKPLKRIGQVSYGIYVLHMLPLQFFVAFVSLRPASAYVGCAALLIWVASFTGQLGSASTSLKTVSAP